MQNRLIKWTIFIPMDFPDDWSDADIDFHLNESGWCASNIIPLLEKYEEDHGCICNICDGVVVDKGKTQESIEEYDLLFSETELKKLFGK